MNEETKKIMILANNSGGLALFRGELIKKLIEQYQVVALCPFRNRLDELKQIGCRLIDVPIERRGINPQKDIKLLKQYIELVKAENPDYIITYTIKPNIYGGFAARMLGIRYSANISGLGTAFEKDGILKKIVIRMYKTALKKAETVFFENSSNQRTFINAGIVSNSKTCLLNGAGVNLKRFSFLPYPKDEGRIVFLFMGRIMKEKGVDELINTFRRLHQETSNCILEMIGNLEENYNEKIDEGIEAGWLHYYGFQNDVRPYIQNSHCFILPSWHEGMANTNLECAASGRPIITSNIPGCKEAVIDGISGFLCEPNNSESLYQAIKKMLFLSREERAQMGEAGRKHMEELFDKDKIVNETITHLRL